MRAAARSSSTRSKRSRSMDSASGASVTSRNCTASRPRALSATSRRPTGESITPMRARGRRTPSRARPRRVRTARSPASIAASSALSIPSGPSSSSISRISVSSLSIWFISFTVLHRLARLPDRLELFQRLVDAGPRAVGRAIQRRAYLLVFETREFAHHERLTLLVRQPGYRAFEIEPPGVPVAAGRGGREVMVAVARTVAIADHACAPHIVTRAIAAEIGRDSVQPRPQAVLRIELRISAVGAQPGFLEEVERVVLIASDAPQKTYYLTLVAAERLLERRRQGELGNWVHRKGYTPAKGPA